LDRRASFHFFLQRKIDMMVERLYVGSVEDCGMRLTKL
jgi:hypothetical protein